MRSIMLRIGGGGQDHLPVIGGGQCPWIGGGGQDGPITIGGGGQGPAGI